MGFQRVGHNWVTEQQWTTQILQGVSFSLRFLNSQGLHSEVPVFPDAQILCTCRKESSFYCLFFLGVCCLIVGHFKSTEKQNCSLLVVQTHLRLAFLFLSPLLMLAICLICYFSLKHIRVSDKQFLLRSSNPGVWCQHSFVLPWVTILLPSVLIGLEICWNTPHRFLPTLLYLYSKYHFSHLLTI